MSDYEITEKTVAMRTGNLKMKRDGEYWTDEERETLRFRFQSGTPYNEIAIELERSETAIYQQVEQLQLYVKNTRAPRKRCPTPQEPVCLCSVCTLDRSQCPRCKHYLSQQEVD